MQDYLDFEADQNDPEVVSLCNELSLWSAPFGLMLLDQIELKPHLQVLDLGCGSGFPLFELAHRLGSTCRIIGIDIWDSAVELAQRKLQRYGLQNVTVMKADGAAMPFPDQHFDLIVTNCGVNNFSEPIAVLKECARVTKPAGRFAMATNTKGHMAEFYKVFVATLRELDKKEELEGLEKHMDGRFPLLAIQTFFEQSGFKTVKFIEDSTRMRFLDGSALLRHFFIKLGFLDAWKELIAPGDRPLVFSRLEENLNQHAKSQGELSLTIPMLYLEGAKKG